MTKHICKKLPLRRTLKVMIYSCGPSKRQQASEQTRWNQINHHWYRISIFKRRRAPSRKVTDSSQILRENPRLNQNVENCQKTSKRVRLSRANLSITLVAVKLYRTHNCGRDLGNIGKGVEMIVMERLLRARSEKSHYQANSVEFISAMRWTGYVIFGNIGSGSGRFMT